MLKSNDKGYCSFTHFENGRVTTRRLSYFVVQAKDGKVYTLTGAALPDAVTVWSGESQSGECFAQVLMNPRPQGKGRDIPRGWPDPRDLLSVILGLLLYCGIDLIIDSLKTVAHTISMQ